MLYYRLYELTPNGQVNGVIVDSLLQDDEAAIAFARLKHRGMHSELWNEGRHVASFVTTPDGSTDVRLFNARTAQKPEQR